MTVRRILIFVAALLGLLAVTGCSQRASDQIAAETDDPFFVQGRQLQRQGRNPEALTAFLKVIEKRGERAAPESHLEAGQIYLNHTKDPVEAYHHFRKYLELQPNSRQAELVRGMVKASLREFARTVPGRPMEDQSVRLQSDDEMMKLRRENDELRAELAVLRSGGMPLNRPARIINPPLNPGPVIAPVAAPQPASPITHTPRGSPPPGAVAQSNVAAPANASRPPPANARPGASPTASRGGAPSAGRTHTVAAKDTLFNLSKKYGVKMEDLAAANGLPSVSAPLRLGTVLKIPAANGGR